MRVVASALVLVASIAVPGLASAQNTAQLFNPVPIAVSTIPQAQWLVPPEDAVDFATKQLYLQCDAGATAFVVGPFAGSGLIVDDYIRVQGPTNQINQYCDPYSCFSGLFADPMLK